jgi:hypothetical protein
MRDCARASPFEADHGRLLDAIRDVMGGFELRGRHGPGALGAALDAWFTVQLRTHDARLHHVLALRGQSGRAVLGTSRRRS